MAYIKVDHSKFAGTASSVESYVSYMKKQMANAQGEVEGLVRSWEGADYTHFETQWNKVDDNGSTYNEMVKAFEAYAKFLRYAEGKYKDAQAKAVNRANSLPRF